MMNKRLEVHVMSKWNIARRGVVLLVIALLAQFPGMGTNGSGGTRGPDEEPPVLAVDNTPWETETGGELTFSVNVTDNSSVAEVRVNYTYGGPEYYNLSMNRTVGDTWNQTINVSIHAVFIN